MSDPTPARPTLYVLWPTIRPDAMRSTWKHWLSGAARPEAIRLRVAVNTVEERRTLGEIEDVLVAGTERPGAAFASYLLFRSLQASPDDIVVFGADDIFAPPGWDEWLVETFRGREDAIIVNDGGQYGACVTQPIMTYACALKLNRVVIHPSYHHFYADAELFANLTELRLVRDLRRSSGPVFEHRNWAWKKRERDAHDDVHCTLWNRDSDNFQARMRLPLAERLKVDEQALADLRKAVV